MTARAPHPDREHGTMTRMRMAESDDRVPGRSGPWEAAA